MIILICKLIGILNQFNLNKHEKNCAFVQVNEIYQKYSKLFFKLFLYFCVLY
ncbi:hypothetical protein A1OE_1365 [Candidatus Endolissoclinum faulkneri L2]|uniref:Uncharacterized protein n=1 Tax=Candidatus Endolissoclinum faulkneri L2 TaxID=1193729 RepID=K7ZDH8_9PROT|nr:hypothetical protein A1OE_1365 [Candidatus Endolissoclinum faulkneri L2]